MRIEPWALWVVPVAELGGVARHVLDVAGAGLPGYRLAVLCPEGPLARLLRARGVAALTGPFGPRAARTPGVAAAASSATLRHAIRTLRPAVVHSHLAYADVIAATVVKGPLRPGTPGRIPPSEAPLLVSTEHGIAGDASLYHSSARRSRVTAAVHRVRLARTDSRIAVADATARVMAERWGARGVTVIRNGVSARRTPSQTPDPSAPRVLSLARLAPEKGLLQLLEAFEQLRARHPRATLTLAGDGPQRERLAQHVRRRGLTDAVSMPGYVPARDVLATHDVLVQLSRWENCSYTLLDAAAAGLGVVATDVGGNGEILPPACLVDPHDPDPAGTVARRTHEQCAPGNRPGLPGDWPTVEDMAARITAQYGPFGRSHG